MKQYRFFGMTILFTAFVLSGCASTRVKSLPPLNGMIYDADNKPVSDVRIEIDKSYIATSDIQGHFVLPKVKTATETVIVASKPGFESASLSFTYTNVTQVLYIRMISGEQLIEKAEREVTEKNWSDAQELLDRADAAAGDAVMTGYLRAVILAQTGKPADAAVLLENLLSSGANEPYIDLFLADLYQFSLSNSEKTREALTRFLAAKSNDDVKKRLDELKQ